MTEQSLQRRRKESQLGHQMSRGEFLRVGGLAALACLVGGSGGPQVADQTSRGVTQSLPSRLEPVLDRLQRASVDYFLHNRARGLILDQFPVANWPYSSMAATGMGMSAVVIAAEKGMISRERAATLVDETLSTIERTPTLRHRGWFTHFVDVSDPTRPIPVRESERPERPTTEYSSIDTALFFLSALPVGTYFGNQREIGPRIEALVREVDFPLMLNLEGVGNRSQFSHGFFLDQEGREIFIPTRWDTCSEGILVSLLSLADRSPSVPIEVWGAWSREYHQLPLFVRYYPHCFIDLRNKIDPTGLDLWRLAEAEVDQQLAYCRKRGYPDGMFGVTACAFCYRGASGGDQYGYFVPNFGGIPQPRVIAPHAIVACLPFAPKRVTNSLVVLSESNWLESEFGPINSVNLDDKLVHRGTTAIDIGTALMMLDASQSRIIHQLAGANPRIQAALRHCGFSERSLVATQQ